MRERHIASYDDMKKSMTATERVLKSRERSRRWYAANRDKQIAASRRHYAANPEQAKENARRWKAENPEKTKEIVRRWYLKKEFGISPEQYDEMLASQGSVCAVCGNDCATGKRLAVDHDHETGRVRGLLCFKCNRGLGSFGDSPERLTAAASYLNAAQTVLS